VPPEVLPEPLPDGATAGAGGFGGVGAGALTPGGGVSIVEVSVASAEPIPGFKTV